MAKTKISRKKLLSEPDEFLSLSQRIWYWVHENQTRTAGIAAGAAAVVLLIFLGMKLAQRSHAARVNDLARSVERYLAVKEGAVLAEVPRELEDFAKKHAGNTEGRLARYFLGGCLAGQGDYSRSAEAFLLVEKAATSRSDLGLLARAAQGYLALVRGEDNSALEAFQKLLEEKGVAVPRAQLKIQIGMILEKKARVAEARRIFQDVAQAFPQSAWSAKAEERLRLLDKQGKSAL